MQILLKEKDYRIGIYNSEDFFLYKDIYEGRIDNMRDDVAVPSNSGRMVKTVFRMAMIKYAPWDLKDVGYRLQNEIQRFRASKNGGDYETLRPTAGCTADAVRSYIWRAQYEK